MYPHFGVQRYNTFSPGFSQEKNLDKLANCFSQLVLTIIYTYAPLDKELLTTCDFFACFSEAFISQVFSLSYE